MNADEAALQGFPVWEFRQGRWQTGTAVAPAEQVLVLRLNGQPWVSLLASPHDPLSLALGYLANEGVIHTPADVLAARVSAPGLVDVRLRGPLPERPRLRTTGCGRGWTRAPAMEQEVTAGLPRLQIAPRAIFALLRALQSQARLYAQAGGVHAAGVGTPDGVLRWWAEDIGRHNAVDRVRGLAWRAGATTAGLVLISTGRLSGEMALKAARMGCPVAVSRTAATDAAIEVARRWGLTLVAYARGRRLRVYTHPERLTAP